MAKKDLEQLKTRVMRAKGYNVNSEHPDDVKYEIAKEEGIPLKEEGNEELTSKQAGKIGGPIGGNMVKEMVKMAQQQMERKN
ncbi:alpha/beta-type small acid-soluble spore protein [Lentibacillus daqui]|uniref:alpha/beta-type small acid-soluble spore protein n=1 Tax=Lentibacillus daqui TaxID=2911514 RepID=UPI0022B1ABF3|nr:alpha/beta-type small acid-soluble spore protein [Lentibacillus daqui]